ncbi:phosphoribosyltransferase [Teichococcus wenyumeiae]|nr:phosphoribosyltransferase family protein [Pseudoroseomonas wenyumeiae]
MMFRNRTEAGRALARRLGHLREAAPVVLALPRGGVPVGFEVATALPAPLDLLLVRKVGAPGFPELAAGAVAEQHPTMLINEDVVRDLGISRSYLEQEAARQRAEIERRRGLYRHGRAPLPLEGRTVILVDDGVATGATVRVALQALAQSGAARRIVLAVPVAPPSVAEALRGFCDEAVFLATPEPFGAVGSFFADFTQVEDAEVIALLQRGEGGPPSSGAAAFRPGR